MSTALQKKIRQVEDEHAEETLQNHLQNHSEKTKADALFSLGAIGAADKLARAIARTMSANAMRSLMLFQENKMHEALGFARFDDFLNESEYSPMTKSQFYERKALLEREGDGLFDLLNSSGIPIYKRKLLGTGQISLDGETVIITTELGDGTSSTQQIELNDRTQLLETLTALADRNSELAKKADERQKRLDKFKDTLLKAEEEIERVKTEKRIEAGLDPHSNSLMNLIGAFAAHKQTVEKMSDLEKAQYAPRTFETIAAQLQDLTVAYDRNIKLDVKKTNISMSDAMGDPTGELLTQRVTDIVSEINDDELAHLMD